MLFFRREGGQLNKYPSGVVARLKLKSVARRYNPPQGNSQAGVWLLPGVEMCDQPASVSNQLVFGGHCFSLASSQSGFEEVASGLVSE